MNREAVEELQQMIDKSSRIVFFGGAGVSTESGVPDFRSKGGLFSQKMKYSPKRVLSKTFYNYKPEYFYDFYRTRMLWPDIKPNAAHRKLAELEAAGKLSAVITQNIDGLHQAAGSKNVLELHGTTHRNYCIRCRKEYSLDYMLHTEGVPHCTCGGVIRPDIVLYEERLKRDVIEEAIRYTRDADMLIIGGTSLSVYPATKIIKYFKGTNRVLINRDTYGLECMAKLVMAESIGEVLGQIRVTPGGAETIKTAQEKAQGSCGEASGYGYHAVV